MARPLSFERALALDAAMNLIWARGYRGASLADLVDATGLNKSSIYNSFGNKHGVLSEVIDHYTAAQVGMLEALLAAHGMRKGLRLLFDNIIDDNNEGRGCLLVNCSAELAPRDRRVAKLVRSGLDALASVLVAQAAKAQAAQQLSRSVDRDMLARSLIASIAGLRILVKAGLDRGALQSTAMQLLKLLLPAPSALSAQSRVQRKYMVTTAVRRSRKTGRSRPRASTKSVRSRREQAHR
jgi:TetR/AcrR family transcriptional repressor of nem operon